VVVLGRPDQSDELNQIRMKNEVVTGLSLGLRVAGRGYDRPGRTRAKGPALDSQEVSMTMQSSTASLNAPAAMPALRSIFRRVIGALIEARERRASQYAADYLRDRPELRDGFRIELERRFMGQ
jgi:hypothetical protein